jgi:hypothetical protein
MARLKGLLKLEGSVDNLIFYQLNGVLVARSKPSISKSALKKSKKYRSMRANAAEMGEASKSGKLFRNACGEFYLNGSERLAYQRVTKLMKAIQRLDQSALRGKRTVDGGMKHAKAMNLFMEFQFNKNLPTDALLANSIEVVDDAYKIKIRNLLPKRDLTWPEGATHCILKSGLVKLDFKSRKHSMAKSEECVLALKEKSRNIELTITDHLENIEGVSFHLLGITYWQEMNGNMHQLMDDHFRLMRIVGIH